MRVTTKQVLKGIMELPFAPTHSNAVLMMARLYNAERALVEAQDKFNHELASLAEALSDPADGWSLDEIKQTSLADVRGFLYYACNR